MRLISVKLLFVIFIAACGSDSDNDSDQTALNQRVSYDELQGLWQSDGYNQLIEVTDEQILIYQFSRSHCLLVEEEDIEDFIKDVPYVLSNDRRDRFATDPKLDVVDIQPYYYDSVNEYPLACADGITPETNDAVINFQAFWNTFNEQYAFFELRGVDWQSIYDKYLVQAQNIRDTGKGDLFDLFEEILPEFDDSHTFLEDERNDRDIESGQFGLGTSTAPGTRRTTVAATTCRSVSTPARRST